MSVSTEQKIVEAIAQMTDICDLRQLETSLLNTVNEIFQPQWAALYYPDSHDDELHFSMAVIHGQLAEIEQIDMLPEEGRSLDWIELPMMGKNQSVLAFLRMARERAFNATDVALLKNVFRIYDNYLTALHNAHVDRLTGLFNRHTFDEQLHNAMELIRQQDEKHSAEPVSGRERKVCHGQGHFYIAVLDIDHFKRVNDNYGHLYGDEVLIILAGLLRQAFRSTDLIYRFGGEEFVIIIYVENAQDAFSCFERLRRKVESYDFPQVGNVTVSLGYTRILTAIPSAELLGHADQALYYAKEHGRNQCCFYEDLLERLALEKPASHDDFTLF